MPSKSATTHLILIGLFAFWDAIWNSTTLRILHLGIGCDVFAFRALVRSRESVCVFHLFYVGMTCFNLFEPDIKERSLNSHMNLVELVGCVSSKRESHQG